MSGKKKVIWNLEFLLVSDWIIKGSSYSDQLDLRPLTDSLNRPYIPASTIKGRLRHEFRKLKSLPLKLFNEKTIEYYEELLFGKPGSLNGQLYFRDAILEGNQSDYSTIVRSRIAIDRNRRVVKDQALLFEEVVGKDSRLSTNLYCYLDSDDQEVVAALVSLAILNIREIGSGKSIGRGQIEFQFSDEDKTQKLREKSTVSVDIERQINDFERWKKEDFHETIQLFKQGGEI